MSNKSAVPEDKRREISELRMSACAVMTGFRFAELCWCDDPFAENKSKHQPVCKTNRNRIVQLGSDWHMNT